MVSSTRRNGLLSLELCAAALLVVAWLVVLVAPRPGPGPGRAQRESLADPPARASLGTRLQVGELPPRPPGPANSWEVPTGGWPFRPRSAPPAPFEVEPRPAAGEAEVWR